MRIEVLADAEHVPARAASLIAESARASFRARQRFVIAVSGGRTPWLMLRMLANEKVPWDAVHVLQVDERIARLSAPTENSLTSATAFLRVRRWNLRKITPCPVELPNLDEAAEAYHWCWPIKLPPLPAH